MRQLLWFPFTWLCVALIFVLSFFTPPHTPLDNVSLIDKWTHLAMYGGTVGIFWLEYIRAHRRHALCLTRSTLILITLAIPIALGGIIELLQAYCTNGRRSGEWLDWAADSLGALIFCILGATLFKYITRQK